MDHLPKLIIDLALILTTGAIVTLVFKRIRQPLVLGYIIAGILVGPYLSLFPTVIDTSNIETLAEIGIIFLLFSLGLEFNLKKIARLGGSATVTALVEIVFISSTGFFLGRLLGWTVMDSIFLGGMLASSSTTIIIKAFDDLGIKTRHFAQLVFGVLVIEDIVVILLLVLLPTIAVARQFAGTELLISLLKLVFFLILMVVTGIFILPTIFRKIKTYLNEETLLILSVGLCLGMVVIATQAGFSAELGAFIMGFILAESTSAEKVEKTIKPVKDMFAAVFFVSIGMMIDPEILLKYGWEVLAVSLLTIAGKLISTSGGALISGQPLKTSVQVGMSMAQIGEFAFIVATLGLSLGVISEFLFPVAVGASAITTFTTPYLIKYSEKLSGTIENILPESWMKVLNNYSSTTQTIQTEKGWKKLTNWYLSTIIINSIVVIALILLSSNFLAPLIEPYFTNIIWYRAVGLTVTLGISAPFLWGLMGRHASKIEHKEIWINRKYNRGPLYIMEMVRVIIGILIIGYMIDSYFSTVASVIILVPIVLVTIWIFSRQLNKFHNRLRKRFLYNLIQKDKPNRMNNSLYKLKPWDAHVIELEVEPYANFVGKALEDLLWREKFGISIAYVKRGNKVLYAPRGKTVLFPHDHIGIIATDDQMLNFNKVFESEENTEYTEAEQPEIVMQHIQVNDKNNLKRTSIKKSEIRERTNGLIIGIERDNERILNPSSSTILEWGDIIWIAGESDKIKAFVVETQKTDSLMNLNREQKI